MSDPVTDWANDVLLGRIVAGPNVRNAAARHIRDLEFGAERGLTWDAEAAAYVCGFFPEVLRLAGGQFEGRPFELHPTQVFKVGSIFGWKRADGTRRFRRAYIEEGKGNGKSPLAAGIGLYCLVCDDEPRAEVYAAAADKDQAQVLFRDAVAMREQSPALEKRLTPSGGNPVWNLADLQTGSFFRPISSEKRKSGSGPRPSCALCDEVHEHPDRLTIEMLERGFKWRRQPLLIMITNSGSDRNSVAWEERSHAVKVAAGDIIDDETFSFVCGLDEDDDPLEDPSCWEKSNPLLGITIQRDYLESVVRQARSIPGKLNGILRLHFCVWTDAEEAWMSRKALEPVLVDFDPAIHEGKDIACGIDLSATQDLAVEAFGIQTGTKTVERVEENGTVTKVLAPTYDVWVDAWTPGDTLKERSLRDKAPYEEWAADGFLKAPPGRIIRLDYMAANLAHMQSNGFGFSWVAYDRFAFRKFEQECAELGLTLPFVEHPQGGRKRGALPESLKDEAKKDDSIQGLWMPGSLAELESVILEQRIRLRMNPVLISSLMSAVTEEDPFGNRWLSKRRATNRIDAAVAICMVIGALTMKRARVIDTDLDGWLSKKAVMV